MNIPLFSVEELLIYFFVLCRVAAVVSFMPGLGANYIPTYIKIGISMVLSVIISPIVSHNFTGAITHSLNDILIITINETLFGLAIGLICNILMNALQIAGNIISTQSGLNSSEVLDPVTGTQNFMIGNLLSITFSVMFLASDLQYLIINGIIHSYDVIHISYISDITFSIVKIFAHSFETACKVSAPMLVIGIVFYFCAGVLNRLMPNMQIFFVMTPMQIWVSFYILMITLSGLLLWYIDHYARTIENIFHN